MGKIRGELEDLPSNTLAEASAELIKEIDSKRAATSSI